MREEELHVGAACRDASFREERKFRDHLLSSLHISLNFPRARTTGNFSSPSEKNAPVVSLLRRTSYQFQDVARTCALRRAILSTELNRANW